MKTTTYRAAQQAYDRMEHPDYWDDHEEEDEEAAERDAQERKIMLGEARGEERRGER